MRLLMYAVWYRNSTMNVLASIMERASGVMLGIIVRSRLMKKDLFIPAAKKKQAWDDIRTFTLPAGNIRTADNSTALGH